MNTNMRVQIFLLPLYSVLFFLLFPPSFFQDGKVDVSLCWGTAEVKKQTITTTKTQSNIKKTNKTNKKQLLNSLQHLCITKTLCFMLCGTITDPWGVHTLCVLPFQTVNILPIPSEYINLWDVLSVVPFFRLCQWLGWAKLYSSLFIGPHTFSFWKQFQCVMETLRFDAKWNSRVTSMQ